LKQLKNPRWQREHQERIRLAKEEIAEATLIGDVERARLAKGKLRHLEDPTSYRSEESWNAFVESGKDYDVWLEERRQKVKETGYCDCCEQWDEAAVHRWN
jgi:hypothetical protein